MKEKENRDSIMHEERLRQEWEQKLEALEKKIKSEWRRISRKRKE